MKHMLQICCKNNNISKEFPIGSSLLDIYYGFNLNFPYQVVWRVEDGFKKCCRKLRHRE